MIDVSKYENASRNEITKAIDKCFAKLEKIEKQKNEIKKTVKELQKFFNNSLKQTSKKDAWLEEYYKSDEFLQAVKETEELKAAYLRGEVQYLDFEEFAKESMKW